VAWSFLCLYYFVWFVWFHECLGIFHFHFKGHACCCPFRISTVILTFVYCNVRGWVQTPAYITAIWKPSGQCPSCLAEEDFFYLFIACPRSTSFWNYCGIDVSSMSPTLGVEQLWLENQLQESNARIKSTILTCLLWNIWKCKNTKVFRQKDETNSVIADRCKGDLVLWFNRCSSSSDKMKVMEWINFFFSCKGF